MTTTETLNPGAVDMEEELYHQHPTSLSVSGAKKLLPPSTPAHFQYDRLNPPERKSGALEFGSAAHAEILGTGPELVVVHGVDDWRTKAAREAADEIRARGAIPLLAEQREQITAMGQKLREHPLASRLLDPERGRAEQSLFWVDPESGAECRARLDWLPDRLDDGRLIVADYKTAQSAYPWKFAKSVADFSYNMQDWWYLDGLNRCGLADNDAAFVFIAQEKVAPYEVAIIQLDDEARSIGAALSRKARNIFAECTANDHWPGYDPVTLISLPAWYIKEHS